MVQIPLTKHIFKATIMLIVLTKIQSITHSIYKLNIKLLLLRNKQEVKKL